MEPNDLVPVRFYDDPMEAHLGRCLLQNEGIEAYIHDEHIIGLNRAFGVALGGVKLKVAATDKEQALLILQETEHRPYLDEDDQPVCCPKCGSTDLQSGVSKPRTNSGKFHWLLGLLFGVYPIVMERGMNCNACGEQFVPEEVAAVTT
ncbi:MAG: DUF2007 domain-containing protein [Flavobacteriales bacterium]|nr:DUF2007 domain-containing protein [Flavobacteriales bacterium]MBK6892941.1 DUF2007 domain-containing protein [Flavobacteriales bacterium]MBK7247454.1 DUF2007 domain-containing protein [Flavobacteriales bacterium]MBK7286340.1 DUF2007 domain-containing protein [Flavobacteriales bacterium]MBK9061305.1 DUF2007 domain-containing protein [Flavobacteriales bacterium]